MYLLDNLPPLISDTVSLQMRDMNEIIHIYVMVAPGLPVNNMLYFIKLYTTFAYDIKINHIHI